MELIQDISRVFGKWFDGEQLMGDEIEFITFCIIIGVLLIICIILLLCLAYESHLWRSIRWAFEDLWKWKRNNFGNKASHHNNVE